MRTIYFSIVFLIVLPFFLHISACGNSANSKHLDNELSQSEESSFYKEEKEFIESLPETQNYLKEVLSNSLEEHYNQENNKYIHTTDPQGRTVAYLNYYGIKDEYLKAKKLEKSIDNWIEILKLKEYIKNNISDLRDIRVENRIEFDLEKNKIIELPNLIIPPSSIEHEIKKSTGEECLSNYECASKVCHLEIIEIDHQIFTEAGICIEATCSDGVHNQTEEKTDCGGTCLPCPISYSYNLNNGDDCLFHTQCRSGFCKRHDDDSGTCIQATCRDGVQNQKETDIDCGGTYCRHEGVLCEAGRHCEDDADCISKMCIDNRCKNDELNEINSLFFESDYHPLGLLRHAKHIYNRGDFPTLPYLTPIRDQGARGICVTFARIAGAEIVTMEQTDLSEQFHTYITNWNTDINFTDNVPFHDDIAISREDEWPYNRSTCTTGYYFSRLITKHIPCTETVHQGFTPGTELFGNTFNGYFVTEPDNYLENYASYAQINASNDGRCILKQNIDDQFDSFDTLSEKNLFLYNVLNSLGYPISFATGVDLSLSNQNGYIDEDFFGHYGHAMAIVAIIHPSNIPDEAKENTSFQEHDDDGNPEYYYIVKNSHGRGYGDSGFLYFPGSRLLNYIWDITIYKYDEFSTVYKNPTCPRRGFFGVIEP